MVRLADRYAAWFLPVALVVAGVAWLVSGSAVRAVAVLVVATPCPLLLAAPVAIVSGLSRASRLGVVIRSGGALENLGRARTLVMDKTGTLTVGRPAVVEVATAPGRRRERGAAAGRLDRAALPARPRRGDRRRGPVTPATAAPCPAGASSRQPGRGVTGHGRRATGRRSASATPPTRPPTGSRVVLSRARLDGAAVWRGSRSTASSSVRCCCATRCAATRRAPSGGCAPPACSGWSCSPATGSSRPARSPPCWASTTCYAEQTPADKVAAVRAERRAGGDGHGRRRGQRRSRAGRRRRRGRDGRPWFHGVVGGRRHRAHRRTDSTGSPTRWRSPAAPAGSRCRAPWWGWGCHWPRWWSPRSGGSPPAAGALLQEGIDVAVILNALRALAAAAVAGRSRSPGRPTRWCTASPPNTTNSVTPSPCSAARRHCWPPVPPTRRSTRVRQAHAFLTDRVLPHEHAEDTQLYPALATPLGGQEATAPMSRTHAEIQRLSDRHRHPPGSGRRPATGSTSTRSRTCWRRCMASTRYCACTSRRRRRTTSRSPPIAPVGRAEWRWTRRPGGATLQP